MKKFLSMALALVMFLTIGVKTALAADEAAEAEAKRAKAEELLTAIKNADTITVSVTSGDEGSPNLTITAEKVAVEGTAEATSEPDGTKTTVTLPLSSVEGVDAEAFGEGTFTLKKTSDEKGNLTFSILAGEQEIPVALGAPAPLTKAGNSGTTGYAVFRSYDKDAVIHMVAPKGADTLDFYVQLFVAHCYYHITVKDGNVVEGLKEAFALLPSWLETANEWGLQKALCAAGIELGTFLAFGVFLAYCGYASFQYDQSLVEQGLDPKDFHNWGDSYMPKGGFYIP